MERNGGGGGGSKPARNWDRITAICSMFIAVLALAVSVGEAVSNRKHQRLSLSPAVIYWANLDSRVGPLGITIRNAGVGPAFLDSLVVFDNERRLGLWDDQTWKQMAEALAIPDPVLSAFDLAMFEPGAVVRDGGEWLLCGFSQSASIHEPWVQAILQRFGFVLWYKSAYDEQKMRPILERNLPQEFRVGS